LAAVAVLLCVLLCVRPVVAAAGVGAVQERNVRVIKTGPFGYVRWIEVLSPSEKGKRYWVVPSYEYASWKEYTQFRNGYMAIRLTEPPRGIMDSYREAGGLLRMVSMATGNWSLFIRGFRDIWHAVNESANFIGKGMANLNDPQKLYEFWKEKGIYDKYTPGERAFLNQVVMPAVAAAQWTLGGLAGGLTGVGAAFGLATLLGLSLGPVVLALSGAVLGIAVVGLVSHFKGEAVREKGADISALVARVESGVEETETGKTHRLAVQVSTNGLLPTLELFGIAGGALAGVGGLVGGYLTAQQEHNILATYNAYGIPELVETSVPPAVWDDGPSASRPEKKTWELIYSLCR
jgi:hypothetical protein